MPTPNRHPHGEQSGVLVRPTKKKEMPEPSAKRAYSAESELVHIAWGEGIFDKVMNSTMSNE